MPLECFRAGESFWYLSDDLSVLSVLSVEVTLTLWSGNLGGNFSSGIRAWR